MLIFETVNGVTSPDYRVFAIRNAERYHPSFFLRLFQSAYHPNIFYAFGQGASQFGRWRLPTEAFNEFALPFPSMAEQVHISQFLDEETKKIDALIEEQRRLIELLKEKRQAVISHAVTKGLDPRVASFDSSIEWLDNVPTHWVLQKCPKSCAPARAATARCLRRNTADTIQATTQFSVVKRGRGVSWLASTGLSSTLPRR